MEKHELLRYIPLRTIDDERVYLRALKNALDICEYVDHVDKRGINKSAVIQEQMKEFFDILFSMLISTSPNHKKLKKRIKSDANDMATITALSKESAKRAFEIFRRYKRLNATFLRSVFGKLMWILMDLKFLDSTYIAPIMTVGDVLSTETIQSLTGNPLFKTAVDPSAPSIQRSEALRAVAHEVPCETDISLVFNSISDSISAVQSNQKPIILLLQWLETVSQTCELSIRRGCEGSCLSHSHAEQYKFVRNTLVLWKVIGEHMDVLWAAVEDDLLNPSLAYSFVDTGQGCHRLQKCPQTRQIAERCLTEAKRQVGSWIGSDVIHLGDRDVPNALVFIDKYTQIPLVLGEITSVILELESYTKQNAWVHNAVCQTYGSVDRLKKSILQDFFKNGFNGSGDDGGSCIDGRLTSVWNWCSLIGKKKFYHFFKLCGFRGFDGRF